LVRTICFLATSVVSFGQSNPPVVPPNGGGNSAGAAEQRPVNADIPDSPNPNETQNKVITLPRSILHDQIGMWASPSKVRFSDATWLVPLGGLTAALFVTDSDYSRHLSNDPSTLTNYRRFSDYGAYAMAGGAAGTYFLGLVSHNDHQRESGFLSGEAAIDSLIAVEALKFAAGRQRPYQNNANGDFWKNGASFPSAHSAGAWAIAGIMAHEYPSPLMWILSYGTASAISVARINAKQHFPSDVLIGAAIGYLTSEYVYRQHHSPSLPGGTWEPAVKQGFHSNWPAKFMGSPYVPLDSWIYPALERLTALGHIDTAISAMRPWTRMECARQLGEAADRIVDDDTSDNEGARLYRELTREFGGEIALLGGGDNAEIRLESAYTRSTGIVGQPLTDSYHFAQTVIDDRGRPEEEGFNNVSGVSGWVTDGPFAVYLNGELQHSPSAAALPLAARQAISIADFGRGAVIPTPWPLEPDTPTPATDQAHLLDTYVAMNLANWQLSYGKQSLWWGPDEGGGMMFSDNADPMVMFRVNRVTPFKLPGFLGYLGPMRVEFFIGQHSGYQFMYTSSGLVGQYGETLHPQPILDGERFSFKPTANFEFGLSRTTDYGGPSYPLTWHNFLRSIYSTDQTAPGDPTKPGSRRSGLDFSYRIRNGLTFYADGMTEHDTVSPLVGPDVAAWLGGIYIPRLPKIPKMDFRAEGVYTDPPIGGNVGSGYFYYNPTWISGFTNAGKLMGNWVGREGQGVQAWTTYWFTPRNKLQFEFRHLKVSREFITFGGTVADGSVRADFLARSNFSLSAVVQYEAWTFPVIATGRQSDVTSSIQLTFWPKGLSRRSGSN
jgi:Capsule assembly protein Wzi/PAP2 superfamily